MSHVSTACTWCTKPGPLFVRPGYFRDLDVDQNDGIPVCPNCGGLGIFHDVDDFRERSLRIRKIRETFQPNDGLNNPPVGYRLKLLKQLKKEVEELLETYSSAENSFADALIDRMIDRFIELYEQRQSQLRERFAPVDYAELLKMPEDVAELYKRAQILGHVDGDLDESEKLHLQAIKQCPNHSVLLHDFGMFQLVARRNREKALEYVLKGCEHEPQLGLQFFSAGRLLSELNRTPEAISYFSRAKDAPDYPRLPPHFHEMVERAISLN